MKLTRKLSPFRIRRLIKKKKNAVHLRWLKKQFAHFGANSSISRILNLGGAEYISIGDNVIIGERCILEAFRVNGKPEIFIDDGANIGDYTHLGAIDFIRIGKMAYIGRFVLILDHSHGTADDRFSDIPPSKRQLVSKGGITIGDNVWIGDKVSILSGVTIGKGAVIGANSVVTKDIPAYSIAAGCPARIIQSGDSNHHIEL